MTRRKLPGLFAAAALFALLAAVPACAKESTFPEGLYIGPLDLGGMTQTEASEALDRLSEKVSSCGVRLRIGENEVRTTAGELGFAWADGGVLAAAVSRVTGGNLIRQYMERKDLEKEPVHFPLQAQISPERLDSFVKEQCSGLISQPKDAAITRVDGRFEITPEETGQTVDARATAERIGRALTERTGGDVAAEAVLVESAPKIRAEQLAQIGDVLGTFSTDFSSSGSARAANLRNGAGKINGVLLMPGETLSGYERMHPFTTDNGYFTAAAYENGQVVDSVGGGVCQIATTLYNAALQAELTITQRQNHSMAVGYVKPSMDAAIAGTYKDIKITNNYSTPVYIEGGTRGRTLFFTVYGKETRPAGRKVEYFSETLGTTDPGEPVRREDKSLPPGTSKQVQSAHIGRKSRLWKVVTMDGAETERTLVSEDTYNASKAIILVGPAAAPAPETQAVPETQAAPVQTPSDAGAAGGTP